MGLLFEPVFSKTVWVCPNKSNLKLSLVLKAGDKAGLINTQNWDVPIKNRGRLSKIELIMYGDGKSRSSFKSLSLAILQLQETTSLRGGAFTQSTPKWGTEHRQGPRKLSSPHTNHNEVVLPVGPEHLVKPERLGLDSAQHGPGAQEGKVSLGPAPPRARRPVPPPEAAPARVTGPRGPVPDGAAPPRPPRHPDVGPRLHSREGPGAPLLAPRPLTTGGAGWGSPACSETRRFSGAEI